MAFPTPANILVRSTGRSVPICGYAPGLRQCPRPWLQRELRQGPQHRILSFSRSFKQVGNHGPLYRTTNKAQVRDAQGPEERHTESVKPESFEKVKEREPAINAAPSEGNGSIRTERKIGQVQINDPLLQESTVSNKEQRQADWAIIKEMSKYLWPKDSMGTRLRVAASVALLIGAKVCIHYDRLLFQWFERENNVVAASSSIITSCTHAYIEFSVGIECTSAFLFQKHRR